MEIRIELETMMLYLVNIKQTDMIINWAASLHQLSSFHTQQRIHIKPKRRTEGSLTRRTSQVRF